MRIWFDTEFYEDGHTIKLISIGMVREDCAHDGWCHDLEQCRAKGPAEPDDEPGVDDVEVPQAHIPYEDMTLEGKAAIGAVIRAAREQMSGQDSARRALLLELSRSVAASAKGGLRGEHIVSVLVNLLTQEARLLDERRANERSY